MLFYKHFTNQDKKKTTIFMGRASMFFLFLPEVKYIFRDFKLPCLNCAVTFLQLVLDLYTSNSWFHCRLETEGKRRQTSVYRAEVWNLQPDEIFGIF